MANKKDVIKQLTIAELQKQQKKLSKVEKDFVKIDGEDYEFTYNVFFTKTKQNEVLVDLVKFLESGIENEEYMGLVSGYITLLTIKHFTSVEIPDEIEDAVAYLKLLIDLGVLAEIINKLPQKEVEDTFNFITERIELMNESMKEEVDKVLAESKEQVEADGI